MIEIPDYQDRRRTNDGSTRDRPDVILLNDRQWSYVQSRYDLTPRERQIAELICQGHRNGKIATVLSIKPGTVKTHTRNIYRKVHVKSKIAMLLKFVTDTRDFFSKYDGFHPAPSTD